MARKYQTSIMAGRKKGDIFLSSEMCTFMTHGCAKKVHISDKG